MSGPKHLWSGDWEFDSSAAREELDRRRRRPAEEEPSPPEPAAPPAARPSRAEPSLGAGIRRLVEAARRTQVGVVAVIVAVLLTAAAGYGLTALIAGAGTNSPPQGHHAYLGIDVSGSPLGIVITNVAPGSPAANAGLQFGDMITFIDNQPIGTVDAVTAALNGLRPGQTVSITFSRGAFPYTTRATLTKAPSAGP